MTYKAIGIPVSDYERELLIILMEECAEVIQASSKLLRFGRGDKYDDGIENTVKLGLEIGDLEYMVTMIIKAGLIAECDIYNGAEQKCERLVMYMQTQQGSNK
jgi:hypothetical protein